MHGNVLFDPPSLALVMLPMFAAAQRDGQIMPLALLSVCLSMLVCTPKEGQ